MVFDRFQKIIYRYQEKIPQNSYCLYFNKTKPKPVEAAGKMMAANEQIKSFLQKEKHSFIDVYHTMLGPTEHLSKNIYVEDNLHMNAKGYSIWKKEIQPHLLK